MWGTTIIGVVGVALAALTLAASAQASSSVVPALFDPSVRAPASAGPGERVQLRLSAWPRGIRCVADPSPRTQVLLSGRSGPALPIGSAPWPVPRRISVSLPTSRQMQQAGLAVPGTYRLTVIKRGCGPDLDAFFGVARIAIR